jgi:aryl-alcohol dehydrogenase-like predicted oxidoreductase
MKENAGAADIELSADEVSAIDQALDTMPMSAVFGGTSIVKK